ncbi:MAG: immune inhibitor A [Chloroflexi bacterium]|nr:immune inhibitor A [Chloroflexota bacterium]
MTRKILIALIGVLLVCICVVVAGTGYVIINSQTLAPLQTRPTATAVGAASSSRSSAAPMAGTPLPSVSNVTADALARTQIPYRDLYQVVPRLRKNSALQTPVPTLTPRTRKVADKDYFFVLQNAATGSYRTVTATLQVVTPNAYFWVDDAINVDLVALKQSADFWEQKVYPTNLKYFGTPGRGLDGETRIHVLNTRFEQAAGYFSGEDSYPRQVAQYSNQRNLIYMNAVEVPPGKNEYNGDLAHEFQHLIHNYQAKYKTAWIDEGMGDLAIKENGFPVLGVTDLFAQRPDTQLNTWRTTGEHYAASYLFFNYAAQRFGPDFIRAVIHTPREGINGVQAVLDERANGMRFDDLFADWAVTNFLNDPTVEKGRYAYTNESMFKIARAQNLSHFPASRTSQMHQYTGSYTTLEPDLGDVTIHFTGTTSVNLLPVNAHGGNWMWYSNRADVSNMSLTRSIDLTRVSGKATLQFWTWYNIEKNYDYGYVQVSTDGGKTFDVLSGKNTTTENPNGSNYGSAFTGLAGTSDERGTPIWVQEQIDLSKYVGKSILLRFEYITDDALNEPGWAIDDITIPEINYVDDVEGGEGGWQAAGFIRTDNVLPQKFSVNVIEYGTTTKVVRMPLDAQNRGSLKLDGFGKDISKAVLVVSAFAPTTTESTQYQISVVPR